MTSENPYIYIYTQLGDYMLPTAYHGNQETPLNDFPNFPWKVGYMFSRFLEGFGLVVKSLSSMAANLESIPSAAACAACHQKPMEIMHKATFLHENDGKKLKKIKHLGFG